jgi:hypothetical protein
LLTKYRALIAQPGKADMKRWIDERWGEGCEANEDGAFPLLDRDSAACSSSYASATCPPLYFRASDRRFRNRFANTRRRQNFADLSVVKPL